MMRSWINNHIPHALLLTGSAACLTLALSSPQDGYTPSHLLSSQEQAEQMTQDRYPAYMDAQGNTRSLAEIIQQARARMQRLQQNQSEIQDDIDPAQNPLAILSEDAQHRRMVKRKDVTALPKANDPFNVSTPDYVIAADPLAWHRPDVVQTHEYTILGYGEVGQEQDEESTSDINTLAQTSQTTDLADVFALIVEANSDQNESLASAIAVPQANTTTALPTVSADAPKTPLAVMPSASQAAPTPVASLSEAPTTRSEPDQDTALRPTDKPAVVNTRPVSTDAPIATAFPIETKPALDRIAPERKNPGTSADEPRAEPTLTKAPALTDVKTKTQPVAQDKPKTTPRVTNKTPTVTIPKHEDSKPQTQKVFPTAPKEVVSAKPLNKNHDDDATSTTPAKTTAKKTNKTTNPLVVLIDDYDKIGSDRLDAIDKALSRINKAVKKTGVDVELKITTDKRNGYNIFFAEDNSNSLGNILGLAEFAVTEDKQGNEFFLGEDNRAQGGKAQVSINNSFNWFAGDDEDEIEADEYDYQTAVEHEFLHLLGLDDNFDDLKAVSHDLLSPGEIRREIQEIEIQEIQDTYANANPWQSQYNPSSWSRNSRDNTRYRSKALTAAVPEPASLAMIGMGVMGISLYRKR